MSYNDSQANWKIMRMDAIVKTLKPSGTSHEPVVRPSREEAEAAVKTLIAWAGDDPSREGLIDTPRRVAKAFEELYAGYAQDDQEILLRVFEEVAGYDDIVLVKNIEFFSHCEHHMVPFTGVAHIAYYPNEGVIGLSKLARVVDVFARRLQTQEALTAQIANSLQQALKPRGLAVLLESEHLCMSMRGVAKKGTSTVTTSYHGLFEEKEEQAKFLALMK